MGDKFIITPDGDRVTARILGVILTLTPEEALDLGAQLTAASLEAFKAHRDVSTETALALYEAGRLDVWTYGLLNDDVQRDVRDHMRAQVEAKRRGSGSGEGAGQ